MEGPPGFETISITGYDAVKAALTNTDLSRSLDKERFETGNIKEGTLSVLHGDEHRERRKMENRLFRREMYELYEYELFPDIVAHTLERFVDPHESDLMEIGGLFTVVLACKTAGIDFDRESITDRQRLRHFLHQFALGGAIDAARIDPAEVKAQMQEALGEFKDEYLAESKARRLELVDRYLAGEETDLPYDMLTNLLEHRQESGMDDDLIDRETGLYFTAGAHTSTQTLTNTSHLVFEWCREHPEDWVRIAEDRAFAQRCVHEALRIRPTNPGIMRKAVEDTEVAGLEVKAGSVLVLDTVSANTDPTAYGADAESFNPKREVPDGLPAYGLSFGAGMHFCPGRTVAVGLPQRHHEVKDDHLYGLVPIALQAVVERGIQPHPDHEPVPDTKTNRWTRWLRYPVVFDPRSALNKVSVGPSH
ncbi:MAG: cytochrome P450 [Acidimicrobiia bacterium]|nr:cytochrome P450 [Acidimicrobiia bacterium]